MNSGENVSVLALLGLSVVFDHSGSGGQYGVMLVYLLPQRLISVSDGWAGELPPSACAI